VASDDEEAFEPVGSQEVRMVGARLNPNVYRRRGHNGW